MTAEQDRLEQAAYDLSTQFHTWRYAARRTWDITEMPAPSEWLRLLKALETLDGILGEIEGGSMTAEQLVLEIRRRHNNPIPARCQIDFEPWPCDAIRAADQIEALLARAGELLDTIFDAGPAPTEAAR